MKREEDWLREACADLAEEEADQLENSLSPEEIRQAEEAYRRHRKNALSLIRRKSARSAAAPYLRAAAVLVLIAGGIFWALHPSGTDKGPLAQPTVSVVPYPADSPTPEPTNTPEPTAEPSQEPTIAPSPAPTATPYPTPTPAPTAAPSPTPSPAPEPTATPSPTPTPESGPQAEEGYYWFATPSPIPSPKPSPTPEITLLPFSTTAAPTEAPPF